MTFSGNLADYFIGQMKFAIQAERLVAWQKVVNDYFMNLSSGGWTMMRYGWPTLEVCGDIVSSAGFSIVTTDNEGTVSFYEYCRNHAPHELNLLTLLQSGEVVTGTIKVQRGQELTEEKRDQVSKKRASCGVARPRCAPNRPHQFLKYSHISGAKKNMDGLRFEDRCHFPKIFGARAISPCNLIMTHSPQQYEHFLDRKRPRDRDIGEAPIAREVMVAAMVNYVSGVQNGVETVQKYFIQARDCAEFVTFDARGILKWSEDKLKQASSYKFCLKIKCHCCLANLRIMSAGYRNHFENFSVNSSQTLYLKGFSRKS
jgi:hypothetical protein